MDFLNSSQALTSLWSNSDSVIKIVATVLALMSIVTWGTLFAKISNLRQMRCAPTRLDDFWQCEDIPQGLEYLGTTKSNPFYALALQGHDAVQHLGQTHTATACRQCESVQLDDWVERALNNSLANHRADAHIGLPLLASIASTAPFIGLFGTVWGIHKALLGIGIAGQVDVSQVAGPIGEALIMTALGLLVAIPAVLSYNAVLRGNKAVAHQLHQFAHDLDAYFLTGARVKRTAPNDATT